MMKTYKVSKKFFLEAFDNYNASIAGDTDQHGAMIALAGRFMRSDSDVEVTEEVVKCFLDASNICEDWKTKIKKHLKIDRYFKFPADNRFLVNENKIANDLGLFIGIGCAAYGFQRKELLVATNKVEKVEVVTEDGFHRIRFVMK